MRYDRGAYWDEKGPLVTTLQKREPFIGPLEEGIRMIPLTQGQYAKVDEEDYEWLSQFYWCAAWCLRTKSFYAIRSIQKSDGSRTTRTMHQFITNFRWRATDHINHDTLDNRKANLRDGTLHNPKNRRINVDDGTSRYHGVSWCKGNQKWCTQIKVNGIVKHVGYFDDEIDAAAAYDAASLKYHGEYGMRNFS